MEQNTKAPNIIFLEFNELCPPLLDQWMEAGLLPNFKKFYDQSEVFTTKPDVETPEFLEPWIQWYSVHTGLPYKDHKVFNLTDGPPAGHPDIWRIMQQAGYAVGNISSMNAAGLDKNGSFYMSDPWCSGQRAFPATLQPIQDFVQMSVQSYSAPKSDIFSSVLKNAVLLYRLVQSGLSIRTIKTAINQLIKEKSDPASKWKRVVLLDHILFDIFKKSYLTYTPSFSTFFSNSTAHLQHAYWRFMEPDAFQIKATEEDLAQFGGAVLFGYQNMDQQLGRFFEMEKHGAKLVLMSALSQQPFTKRETSNGQIFYRPHNIDRVLDMVGISDAKADAVMTHQFVLRFESEELKNAALARLESFTLDGSPIFDVGKSDDKSVFVGCGIFNELPDDAQVMLPNENRANDPARAAFFDLFYKISEIKSGGHHPDGVLWFKLGEHVRHAEKVSILDVLPTLLDIYRIERTNLPISGQSLAPRLSAFA